eukprot:747177-Hanusia_phi.AAC.2
MVEVTDDGTEVGKISEDFMEVTSDQSRTVSSATSSAASSGMYSCRRSESMNTDEENAQDNIQETNGCIEGQSIDRQWISWYVLCDDTSPVALDRRNSVP